ncbi:MAG: HAMP domain-containing protein [Myxococcales bacterium]|nr:HAMP domain-containing protein [Myxococcales bacterium]
MLAVSILTVGSWGFGRRLVAPISEFSEAAEVFVNGGKIADVTKLVPLHDDEVARLSWAFNSMVEMLEELSSATERVAAGNLTVTLERPGQLQDAFRAMIGRLAETVEQIRSTALEVAAASAQIQASIQEQEQASEQQAQSLREVGDAVANLAQSAEAITAAAAGVLVDAEQTRSNTDVTVARITELGTQAAGIGILLGLIAEIAERSDLLALNGSLEATRAGEAGRGFALVAAEMRRLAERVTGIVADMRKLVADIEASNADAVSATTRARQLAGETAEAAREINQETRRQSDDTEHASQNTAKVAEFVGEGSASIRQTRAIAKSLEQQAEHLEQVLAGFSLRDF